MTADAIRVAVRSAVETQLATEDFADDDSLLDLGVDSIDVILIVNTLEDQLGVRVPDEELFREDSWSVANFAQAFAVASDNVG